MPLFPESLPRRVARRPIRWFFALFLLGTALWLLSGFVGIRLDFRDSAPPPPDGVPYDAYMPTDRDSLVPVAPGVERPVFNALRVLDDAKYELLHDDDAGVWRLVCTFDIANGRYGWPGRWLEWRRSVSYDVSDMRAPFPPSRLIRREHATTWNPRSLWIVPGVDDKGRRWFVTWHWARMLLWLAGLELLAAAIVLFLSRWNAVRDRLRVRRGRCVACRYDLRSADKRRACPECGAEQPTLVNLAARKPVARIGRRVALTWLVLVAIWLIAGLSLPRSRVFTPLERNLEQIVEAAANGPPEADGRYWARPLIHHRIYGWPLTIVSHAKTRAYAWAPGASPAPAADPFRVDPLEFGAYQVSWSSQPDDLTLRSHYGINWTLVLAQVMGLQLIAWLVVIVRPGAKRGRSSSARPEPSSSPEPQSGGT